MKLSICYERTNGEAVEHESSFPYELTNEQVASLFREFLVMAKAVVNGKAITTEQTTPQKLKLHTKTETKQHKHVEGEANG